MTILKWSPETIQTVLPIRQYRRRKLKSHTSKHNKRKMALYKLTAKRNYGDLPKGYEIQVPSQSSSYPTATETAAVIKKLGFNAQAQSYGSSGNWELIKVS